MTVALSVLVSLLLLQAALAPSVVANASLTMSLTGCGWPMLGYGGQESMTDSQADQDFLETELPTNAKPVSLYKRFTLAVNSDCWGLAVGCCERYMGETLNWRAEECFIKEG